MRAVSTITPAALTITTNNASRLYGQTNPKFSASYSGFVNGDEPTSLTTQPTFSTTATTTSRPGTYPVIASRAVDPNYTITYVAGTLTVNPPLATVKSVEVEKLENGKQATEVIVVQFSEAPAGGTQDLNNYSLVPKSKKQAGKRVTLAGAAYNAKAFSVTLTTSKALSLNPAMDLTITAVHLLDALGRPWRANYSATLSKAGVRVIPTVASVRARALSAKAVDAALEAGLRWGR